MLGPRALVGTALCLGVLTGCADHPAPRPPNVVVLVVDTLRADRVGAYGAPRDTTPHLDRVAAEGVLMEEAVSAAPRTWQSFVTILTGLYPPHHGVRFIYDDPLAPDVPTLGSLLGAAGFGTALFDVHLFMREMTGGEGFRTVVDFERYGRTLTDAELADEVIAWLAAGPPEPFCAFVRFRGPHWPYRPARRFHDLFGTDAGADHSFNDGQYGVSATRGQGFVVTDAESYRKRFFDYDYPPETLEHMVLHYDAAVRETDETVGRVLDALRADGLLDTTLVVLTSDHGENFGENGYLQHGPRVDRHVLRVPLLIRFPASHPHGTPGQRVPQLVRTADVLPTILAAVGVAAPAGLDGTSLLPAIDAGADLGLTAYGESGREFMGVDPERGLPGIGGKQRMLRDRRWKLVYRHDGAQPIYRLYDLAADPDERHDLAAARPEVVARLRPRLDAFIAGDARAEEADETALTPAQRERLRALGYVQ